jgi:hypothetical protein
MSDKKYLICPDYVISQDGQEHWISAGELIKLYKVKREECLIMPRYSSGWVRPEHLIVLRPKSNGNYYIINEVRE